MKFKPNPSSGIKVPHMGWNEVYPVEGRSCPLLDGIEAGTHFYFVHSYYGIPNDASAAAATTPYEVDFASVIWKDNIFATQFHPEKSQRAGLKLLDNFVKLVG